MTVADYDSIINKGWNEFNKDFLTNRIPKAAADMQTFFKADLQKADMNFVNAGILPFCPAIAFLPFDIFCGGRGMSAFMTDLFRIPDKVQAAADVVMVDLMNNLRQQIRMLKPFSTFIGAARSASDISSPKIWNRFIWPYYKKAVETIVEEGSFAYMHLDGSWDRDIAKFRELPKGKCIAGTDHATDIFKMKELVGDHMCLFGDVPPAMLTIGTPEDVYNYSKKLVNELGASGGFILAAACYVPLNAKVENVKAMVAAVQE